MLTLYAASNLTNVVKPSEKHNIFRNRQDITIFAQFLQKKELPSILRAALGVRLAEANRSQFLSRDWLSKVLLAQLNLLVSEDIDTLFEVHHVALVSVALNESAIDRVNVSSSVFIGEDAVDAACCNSQCDCCASNWLSISCEESFRKFYGVNAWFNIFLRSFNIPFVPSVIILVGGSTNFFDYYAVFLEYYRTSAWHDRFVGKACEADALK